MSLSSFNAPGILFDTAHKGQKTTVLIVKAILAGFAGIDVSAQSEYYREDLVGEALDFLKRDWNYWRDDLFVQTKFDLEAEDPALAEQTIEQRIRYSLEKSTQHLGGPPDSYLLAQELKTPEETLSALLVLKQLVQEGKILSKIGIRTIYSKHRIDWLLSHGAQIDIIQSPFGSSNFQGSALKTIWETSMDLDAVFSRSDPILSLAKAKVMTPKQAMYGVCTWMGVTPLCDVADEPSIKAAIRMTDISSWTLADVQPVIDSFREETCRL
ncbi:NADP-dependent oxidoreductase domain [Phaffia rhodozyma]|uniref:NADP-dependent oxidoreductase domain n=1 Tax=Phaffia rhodozyma TaxID=264483 RepID=A0A0F7STC7_PHARH|nr:NADP-dependent oxidoreductase domain [Phaffia rhodozyma]